jgi:hypothetical protein
MCTRTKSVIKFLVSGQLSLQILRDLQVSSRVPCNNPDVSVTRSLRQDLQRPCRCLHANCQACGITWNCRRDMHVEWIPGNSPFLGKAERAKLSLGTSRRHRGGMEVYLQALLFSTGPVGLPSLVYNGYRVSFPGVKRPGRGVDHPPPSSAEVKERV